MNEEFDLEKRLKVIELAKKEGMFTFRDDEVIEEAIQWFITPKNKQLEQPIKGKVKRLIRILNRKLT